MKFNGRVLVCGSRDFGTKIDESGKRQLDPESRSYRMEHIILDGLLSDWQSSHPGDFTVIEGEAMGADLIAANWATKMMMQDGHAVEVEHYPADWEKYGKGAGPVRNKQMLTEGQPTLVLAFSNDFTASRGTNNMIQQATKAGVPVVKVEIPRMTTQVVPNKLFEE
mgnify:CR=1 FL=1